jgi:Lrp/AsnC family leucine-responsive transcriptional regulator
MMQSSMTSIDDIDRRLLNELQQDSSRPVGEIAQRVGLSPSACYRRIQRLRDAKIILREAAVVDQRRSPWPFTVIVQIALERLNEPQRLAFETKVRGLPQVMQAYSMSGEFDFVIILALADIADYHRFATEILVEDENIKQFKSIFALQCLKSKSQFDF